MRIMSKSEKRVFTPPVLRGNVYHVVLVPLSAILIYMMVYQTKTFARWAKKAGLQDTELYVAAQEVAAGRVEAKLGGNVYKKRVALPGGGKSGGSRTLIAIMKGKHSFYLYGFEKSERSNIKTNELSTLKSVAKVWLSMPAAGLKAALRAGEIKEVKQDE
jgi:hypothetical protein